MPRADRLYGTANLADFAVERHIEPDVCEGLTDTRVVVVLGARQVGKSTLVEQIAADEQFASVITLDDQAMRDGAAEDPAGFVARLRAPAVGSASSDCSSTARSQP